MRACARVQSWSAPGRMPPKCPDAPIVCRTWNVTRRSDGVTLTGHLEFAHPRAAHAGDGTTGCSLAPAYAQQVDGAPAPVIVMCHGLLSHKDHNFAPSLAAALARTTACAVFRFNFRGMDADVEATGSIVDGDATPSDVDARSEEDVADTEVPPATTASAAGSAAPRFRYRFSGFEDDVDDLHEVLHALRTAGHVPWLLLGHSRGANDVLMYAGRHAADFHRQPARAASAPACISPAVHAGCGADRKACVDHPVSVPVVDSCAHASTGSDTPALAVVALAARCYMPAMFTRIFPPDVVAQVEA
ncbi:alpha/beta fold hydrolase, partial [archaeon]